MTRSRLILCLFRTLAEIYIETDRLNLAMDLLKILLTGQLNVPALSTSRHPIKPTDSTSSTNNVSSAKSAAHYLKPTSSKPTVYVSLESFIPTLLSERFGDILMRAVVTQLGLDLKDNKKTV